ncbi:hypothetical protein KC726_02925 [Candidatus Woesebacteria bacterium]|nr:hypothetical protein [Candidatus Woesebacteria bacterium]
MNNAQKLVSSLFQTRDRAVKKTDKNLFLSTQGGVEIEKSGSRGYMETDELKTTVLATHKDRVQKNLIVVFVEEEYFYGGVFSHSQYLLYKILQNDELLTVVDIVW